MGDRDLLDMENTIHRIRGVAELISMVAEHPEFEGESNEALHELSTDLLDIYAALMGQWKSIYRA